MTRAGATHRAAAPSCTPATRDRTGRLHRDVHGRPAACRNPGLLDDSGLASASRPRIARGPQAPGRQPGHPGARSPSPAASGRPGRAPVHPLRRDPRSAPPPGGRSPCGRHDGRGRQRTTAIQEDPVGGTHKGHQCQEGVRTWPGDYARRRAGLTILLDPSSQVPGSSRRAARGQAGAPAAAQRRGRTSLTPASGGRSSGAGKGSVAVGLVRGRVLVPGAWLAEWSRKHPSGAAPACGRLP